MAQVMLRATAARAGSVGTLLGKQTVGLTGSKLSAVSPIQVATLRATYGEPFGYEPPYDYKNKKLNIITEFFDNTYKRINENSKVIIVEGNDAVGKNEFAKRLAKNFDLKYVPSCPLEAPFIMSDNGFDMRTINEVLPDRIKFYDQTNWQTDPHPESGRVGSYQLRIYMARWELYSRALLHLLSTGQGVVITKSVYGDIAYVEALRKLGHISRNLHRYYHLMRDNTLCELLKPHVTVYLDAPVSTIRERITKRGNALEVNSKNMNDEYLQALEWAFKEKTLPKLRETGELLELDWTEVADDMDMEVLTEEMQELHLEARDNEDPKFQDWYKNTEDDLCKYRKTFGYQRWIDQWFHIEFPKDCPEISTPDELEQDFENFIRQHPAIKYEPGWAPQLGHNAALKLF